MFNLLRQDELGASANYFMSVMLDNALETYFFSPFIPKKELASSLLQVHNICEKVLAN